MATKKPPAYDTEGFAGAHQPRGLSQSAREFLERKGALGEASARAAKPKPKKRTKSGARKKSTESASKDAGDPEVELPRRSRRARNLRPRHFRLPLDIDAKLIDLTEFYESTFVWVVCKLIQEEWVRTRRALRRGQTSGEEDPPETPDESP